MENKANVRMRIARTAAGMTQEELANKTGISKQAISKIERGVCDPSVKNAISICKVLGVSVESLFGDGELRFV